MRGLTLMHLEAMWVVEMAPSCVHIPCEPLGGQWSMEAFMEGRDAWPQMGVEGSSLLGEKGQGICSGSQILGLTFLPKLPNPMSQSLTLCSPRPRPWCKEVGRDGCLIGAANPGAWPSLSPALTASQQWRLSWESLSIFPFPEGHSHSSIPSFLLECCVALRRSQLTPIFIT